MIKKNIGIVNSVFTLDASPPALPLPLVNVKGMLSKYKTTTFDLDIDLYDFLGRQKLQYDMIQYLMGGFAFSYPTTANIPSNYYPFETMPMANLLVSMMYLEDQTPGVHEACKKLGINYEDAEEPIKNFMDYLSSCQEKLRNCEEIILLCNSIASVYFAILMAHKVKSNSKTTKIYTVGKNMLIPEIKAFVDSLSLIDVFFEDVFELGSYFKVEEENMDFLDFNAIDISKYNKTIGLHKVNLSCSEGCLGKCGFCSIRLSWNQEGIRDRFRYYPLQSTLNKLRQIEEHLGKCFVHIDDCTFNSGSPFSYELLEHLKNIKMLYSCNLRADLLEEKLITKLKEANFYKAIVGLETVNEDTVKILNKGSKDYVEKAKKAVEALIQEGLVIQTNILLFHPMESKEAVLTGAEKWRLFFKDLNQQGFQNYEAPIGTLCINYPSRMYFDVLNSKDFKINYHTLPDKIKSLVSEQTCKAFESIPDYAIRLTDCENELINKMEIVEAVYQFSCCEETTVDNYINTILNYYHTIMELWRCNKVVVTKTPKLDKLQSDNRLIEMIKRSLNNKVITIENLEEMVSSDLRTFVVTLAIMSREGYVSLDTIYHSGEEMGA